MPAQPSLPSLQEGARLLRKYPLRWIIPTIAVAAASVAYAVTKQDKWESSQALVVRNEAAGKNTDPGKFGGEDLKITQETLLELVKNGELIRGALLTVGPPPLRRATGEWPTPEEIDDERDAIKLVPPNGSQFGKTEVFYLKVQDHSKDRSIAVNTAICNELESKFRELRDVRARSVVEELEKGVGLAETSLATATEKLRKTEDEVGSDLAELRLLSETTTGSSALRQRVTDMESSLREAQLADRSQRELLGLLEKSQKDPSQLLATPSRLLEAQPALKKLKDGLIDAKLRTATLLGSMRPEHPQVKQALTVEREISTQLNEELGAAIAALAVDLNVSQGRVEALSTQLNESRTLLKRFAGMRARYANQISEVQLRTQLLERAQQNLTDARANQVGAQSASQISRIDNPDPGVRPVGPGRSTICAAGVGGGFLCGLGILVLTIPWPSAPTRMELSRPLDQVIFGRIALPPHPTARPAPAIADRGASAADKIRSLN